ncbi:MAG: hypothetical protein IJQ82_00420, partial [Selenomonadaceae bacterium]|nr:hypothetical protein [Selenomonadaceae bacterium]
CRCSSTKKYFPIHKKFNRQAFVLDGFFCEENFLATFAIKKFFFANKKARPDWNEQKFFIKRHSMSKCIALPAKKAY